MHEPNQFDLLEQRRFAPFFWTQFLGAGNDNIYKNALVIFVAYQAASLTSIDANTLVNLAGGDLHPAVRAVLGDGRAARRQVREVAPDPLHQAARDRDHGDRPRRLLAAQPGAAVRRAGADGRALDAVRPGQVRDPAAAPQDRGAGRRQRPGRDGHVRRDPARHDRRRPARRDRAGRAGAGRRGRGRRRGRRAGSSSRAIPAHAGGGAGPRDQLEPVHRDLEEPAVRAAATASSGCRCSASRGSGSTARCSSRSSRPSPRTCWAATSTSSRCCWRASRSASASARCCASGCPGTRSSSAWCRSARSA